MRLGASLVGQWLPRRFVERLREHTGGNPSHIRSVLATLDGAGNADTGDGPLPAPPSCHSIVFERLARCGAGGRRLAAAAAVLGERCSLELVRKLASLDEPLQPLQAAIDARLVECRGRDVVFVNPLVRAALVPPARGLRAGRPAPQGGAAGDGGGSAAPPPRRRRFRLRPRAGPVRRRLRRSDRSRRSALGASGSFVDAADLVPPGPDRDAYALEAVECLLAAGDPAGAGLVAARFVDGGTGSTALVGQAHVARVVGRMEDAEQLLIRAQGACRSRRPQPSEPDRGRAGHRVRRPPPAGRGCPLGRHRPSGRGGQRRRRSVSAGGVGPGHRRSVGRRLGPVRGSRDNVGRAHRRRRQAAPGAGRRRALHRRRP